MCSSGSPGLLRLVSLLAGCGLIQASGSAAATQGGLRTPGGLMAGATPISYKLRTEPDPVALKFAAASDIDFSVEWPSAIDVAPKFYPVGGPFQGFLSRHPFLVRPELESSGLIAQADGGAGKPITSAIDGLLPIALCGLTSL